MEELIFDALKDTLAAAPFLLAIYAAIEIFEYKFGQKIIGKVRKAGAWGPLAGAMAGIFPQCGFSVMAAALYAQRLATLGTLLAVFLATSDEALPIIFSHPENAQIILPLILAKLAVAIAAGYAVDFIWRKFSRTTRAHLENYNRGQDDPAHSHESALDAPACCGHHLAPAKKFNLREILWHPARHTLTVLFFIFLTTLAVNWAVVFFGQDAVVAASGGNKVFEVVFFAMFGLIPNCAASVAITELFLDDMIGFGAAIAGLCASAGLGILVLFKEEKNKKNALAVIGLLFCISVLAGLIFNLTGIKI